MLATPAVPAALAVSGAFPPPPAAPVAVPTTAPLGAVPPALLAECRAACDRHAVPCGIAYWSAFRHGYLTAAYGRARQAPYPPPSAGWRGEVDRRCHELWYQAYDAARENDPRTAVPGSPPVAPVPPRVV